MIWSATVTRAIRSWICASDCLNGVSRCWIHANASDANANTPIWSAIRANVTRAKPSCCTM